MIHFRLCVVKLSVVFGSWALAMCYETWTCLYSLCVYYRLRSQHYKLAEPKPHTSLNRDVSIEYDYGPKDDRSESSPHLSAYDLLLYMEAT